jgi:hypothetical protein
VVLSAQKGPTFQSQAQKTASAVIELEGRQGLENADESDLDHVDGLGLGKPAPPGVNQNQWLLDGDELARTLRIARVPHLLEK